MMNGLSTTFYDNKKGSGGKLVSYEDVEILQEWMDHLESLDE